MGITFEEALEPLLNKIPDQTKGLLYVYLTSGGEPAEEDVQDQVLELVGKHTTPVEIIEKMKVSFQDGFGIIDWVTGKSNNYGKCLDILTKDILPQAFNVSKPSFLTSEDTWEGIEEREEWIRIRFIEHFWKGLGEEEKKKLIEALADELREEGINVDKVLKVISSGQGGLTVLRSLLGFKFHILTAKLVNMVAKLILGRGLSLAANAMIQRYVAVIFGGPIGWGLFVINLTSMFMSRDWKALTPAIALIALIRPEYREE